MSYISVLKELEKVVQEKNLSRNEYLIAMSGLCTSAMISAANEANIHVESLTDDSVNQFIEMIDNPNEQTESFMRDQISRLFRSDTGMFERIFEEKLEGLLTDFLAKLKSAL